MYVKRLPARSTTVQVSLCAAAVCLSRKWLSSWSTIDRYIVRVDSTAHSHVVFTSCTFTCSQHNFPFGMGFSHIPYCCWMEYRDSNPHAATCYHQMLSSHAGLSHRIPLPAEPASLSTQISLDVYVVSSFLRTPFSLTVMYAGTCLLMYFIGVAKHIYLERI